MQNFVLWINCGAQKSPCDVFFQNLHFVFLAKRNEKNRTLDTLIFKKNEGFGFDEQ